MPGCLVVVEEGREWPRVHAPARTRGAGRVGSGNEGFRRAPWRRHQCLTFTRLPLQQGGGFVRRQRTVSGFGMAGYVMAAAEVSQNPAFVLHSARSNTLTTY